MPCGQDTPNNCVVTTDSDELRVGGLSAVVYCSDGSLRALTPNAAGEYEVPYGAFLRISGFIWFTVKPATAQCAFPARGTVIDQHSWGRSGNCTGTGLNDAGCQVYITDTSGASRDNYNRGGSDWTCTGHAGNANDGLFILNHIVPSASDNPLQAYTVSTEYAGSAFGNDATRVMNASIKIRIVDGLDVCSPGGGGGDCKSCCDPCPDCPLCDVGQVYDFLRHQCSNCLGGEVYDPSTGSCYRPVGQPVCTSGMWDTLRNQCINCDPGSQYYDPITGTCRDFPGGGGDGGCGEGYSCCPDGHCSDTPPPPPPPQGGGSGFPWLWLAVAGAGVFLLTREKKRGA